MMQIKKFLKSRTGQSLTSTVIGVAILGIVGVAAASLISAQRTADSALSTSSDVAALMDSYASRIRSTTRYSEIESTFGAGGGIHS